MKPILWLLAIVAAATLLSLLQRLTSRRKSIPCPSWLSFLVELDNPVFRNNSAKNIIADLDLHEGMSVLDIGCGPGRLTIPMARIVGRSGQVVALDVQRAMLEKVRAKVAREKLGNVTLAECAIGQDSVPFDLFDRAVLVTVLGEIPNRRLALREICRVLKPGGILAVAEVIADPHFQSQQTVRNLTAQAGFIESKLTGGRLSYTMYLKKPG